jgi:hypothetical protein
MAALHRRKVAGRRQSESRVRENCTHGLTRGRWGDHFKPVAYSTKLYMKVIKPAPELLTVRYRRRRLWQQMGVQSNKMSR